MQRPIYTQASKKVIFNDLCFVCVNAKVTLFPKTARYSRTIGLGMTWLIGFSCTLRVLSFIWSTKHGQTMWFWQQRNHQHKKTLRWTWKKYMTWFPRQHFSKKSQTHHPQKKVTWTAVGFIGFVLSFFGTPSCLDGPLDSPLSQWDHGADAWYSPWRFPSPKQIGSHGRTTNVKVTCCAVLCGLGRKWISRINA